MRPASFIFVTVAGALASTAAGAHHSSAIYDHGKQVSFDAVVSAFDWSNPHVTIYVDQTNDAGEVVTWEIESSPPAGLRRFGWSRDTLKPGDAVRVAGAPTRNEAARGMLLSSLILDGRELMDRDASRERDIAAEAAVAETADSLLGVWAAEYAMQPGQWPFMSPDQLTEAGAASRAAYSDVEDALRCQPAPPPLSMVYQDVKRLRRDGDRLFLGGEYDGGERVIHLDVASHEGVERTPLGHSIGVFDGRTLEIDTAAFADDPLGAGLVVASGAQKRLVERLELHEDGRRLTYSFTMEDPEHLTAPVSREIEWVFRPDLEYAPAPCTAENAARFLAQ